jgi:hypothetical protein
MPHILTAQVLQIIGSHGGICRKVASQGTGRPQSVTILSGRTTCHMVDQRA